MCEKSSINSSASVALIALYRKRRQVDYQLIFNELVFGICETTECALKDQKILSVET